MNTSEQNPSLNLDKIVIPLLLAVSVGAYFLAASHLDYLEIVIAVFAPAFFLISFLSMKVGLVLMSIAMLFSPEIPVASVGVREIAIRIEDVLIPILALAWLARLALRMEHHFFAKSPLNLPIGLLLLLSLVSSLAGIPTGWVSPLITFFYMGKTLEFFAIYFLVLNYIRTEQDVRQFVFFAVFTVFLIGVYTMTQVPQASQLAFQYHRITAPFEGTPEPATIGGYLAFLLLMVFCMALYEQSVPRRWLFGGLGLLLFIPLVYTLNRTTYVMFLAGMIYIAFCEKRNWLTFLLVGLLLASPFLLPSVAIERIAFTWLDGVNPGREWHLDQSFDERIFTFRKVWNVWRDNPFVHPWIGTGVGSLLITESQYVKSLHEIGLVGLGIWLWIFARLFKISYWLFETLEQGYLKGMALGYRAGLIALLLHGFGTITFFIVRIMEPFWFITGIVVSLYVLKVAEQSRLVPASDTG